MKKLFYLAVAIFLSGCQPVEQAVEPTDGPCGPGAWIITTGPDGVICEPDGW